MDVPLWFAGVLGVVQGLTEFLPISSTAHLRIAPELLGQADPGAAFTAVIQLGTLVSVLVYFRRDLFVETPRAVFQSDGDRFFKRLPFYLVLGTVPVGLLGVTLKGFIVGDARSLYVVAGALIAVAMVFVVVEKLSRPRRGLDALSWRHVAVIGGAQALALIPGVSRSGATIAAGLALGYNRADSARFSFLLGIPAIAGAGIFEMADAVEALGSDALGPLVIGTTTAAISGYLAIHWLMRVLRRISLISFGVYRIILGAVMIFLCAIGFLSP